MRNRKTWLHITCIRKLKLTLHRSGCGPFYRISPLTRSGIPSSNLLPAYPGKGSGFGSLSSPAAERVYAYPLSSSQRSEEHTSELQSRGHLVCRLLLEKKKQKLKGCRQHTCG